MSKCLIEILPNIPPGGLHPGDTVTGTVRVTAFKDMDAKEFTIGLDWRTHGLGNVDTKSIVLHTEDPSAWAKDDRHEVPFSFILPEGPVTHCGTMINVDWYLTGYINLGWLRTVQNEERLLVVPNPELPVQIRKPDNGVRAVETAGPLGGCMTGCFPIAFAGGALFIAASFFNLGDFQFSDLSAVPPMELLSNYWIACALVAVAPVLGTIGAAIIMRSLLQTKRLGAVSISATGDPDGEPGSLIAHISHKSGGTVEITSVTVFIDYREVAVSGAGTTETTHDTYETLTSVRVDGPVTVLPDRPYENHVKLKLPADAAHSFQSTHNEVAWIVGVELEIKGMRTVTRECGIWVS